MFSVYAAGVRALLSFALQWTTVIRYMNFQNKTSSVLEDMSLSIACANVLLCLSDPSIKTLMRQLKCIAKFSLDLI